MSTITVRHSIPVSHVRHRLVLGIEWIDALAASALGTDWATELRAIGTRPFLQMFQPHPRGRFAVSHAGRIVRLLARAAEDKVNTPPATPRDDQTNLVLLAYGQSDPHAPAYATGNDTRRYVPRKLALTPVQTNGIPTATVANIRQAWLWPGTTYPMPSKASAVRGCVRKGAALATASPIAWVRVVFTRPGPNPPDFANEVVVGHAHGDDRGEFLAVFGPDAVPGGAVLPPTIALHAWLFLPPATTTFDGADPLASLPLEVAGTAPLNDVLRGTEVPTGYVRHGPVDVTLPLGRVVGIADADLLFP